MNWLVVLPIIIPIITAMLTFFSWHTTRIQRAITLAGCLVLLATSGLLFYEVNLHQFITTQVGGWGAPYGISLVADRLSAIMVLLTGIIGICVAIYSLADIDKRCSKGGFYPAYCILLAGLNGAFLTGDLFNLYVWFEVILISSFVLLSLGNSKLQLESSVKYVVLNLVATLILLLAIALIYGISGTLNMADLSAFLSTSKHIGLISTIAVIFIVAFGMKAALFPLFFWLPAAYHTPSYSTSAIFAALLSKVGVYALIRVFSLIFLHTNEYTNAIILLLALYTLAIGIIGAIAQRELRRTLSFTLISHIGYMIIGIALMTPLALIGSIFYLIQHVLVKCSLFLSAGVVHRINGSTEQKHCGGIYKINPFFSMLFFICAFSLAGIPPFSGFWPKLILVKAGLETHHYALVVVILAVSLFTLYVMAKLWQTIFLKTAPKECTNQPLARITINQRICMLLPITILTGLVLLIGLFPGSIYHMVSLTVHQLLNPSEYINAVLYPAHSVMT